MVVKNINPIIAKTSTDLNIDSKKVEEVVKYLFTLIRKWTDTGDSPALMLPQLGTFYILDRHVDSSLKKLISKIRDARKNKDSKEHLYITKFRHYWYIRHFGKMYRESLKKPNNARIPRYLRDS